MTAAIRLASRRHYHRLMDASKHPVEAQSELLRKIIAQNAQTEFGKDHRFSNINSVEEFRSAVPVQSYDDLRPYIERQELIGTPSLTAERPVYYHRTSGTVGTPKDIPVTKSGLERIRRHQQISAFAQSKDSRIFDGKVFGVTGQAVEGKMPGGTPYGSASGLLYENQPTYVRSRYVLPPALSAIDDYDARYFAMAAFGLIEPTVTCIATANPSTLVKLLSVINDRSEELIETITSGRFPEDIADGRSFHKGLGSNAARAKELKSLLRASGELDYVDFWPNLKGVVTWTGGSCRVPLRTLENSFPDNCRIIELGYVASEMRGTVNIDVQRNACLPTLLDVFFEFAERDRWEAGKPDFLSLHELDMGSEYYVFATTTDGLYRYDMDDVVRMTGTENATPTLEFVQKGKGVTSITGEKLYEAQVLDAVVGTLSEFGIRSEFFVMLADQETASYTLYVEAEVAETDPATAIAEGVDYRLRATNIEYASKRDSCRLSRVGVKWLRPGAGDAYRSSRVSAGQRDAQFKHLHLQYAHECLFKFEGATLRG